MPPSAPFTVNLELALSGKGAAPREAYDQALALKPDYFEALTYKNLLLRSEALLEKDPAKQQALLKQADQLRDKAQELQKQKQAATAAPSKGE